MDDYKDGDSEVINGVTYTRQGGVWHPQGSTGPILGPPRLPPMQTPDQATGQTLTNQHTEQAIQAQPLQNASTTANINQSNASVQNQHFNQNQGLRQEFDSLPEVKNYGVALGSLGTALKAPDTPQGDLAVIYAYAKAADPGSVVREGEMDMATATASLPQAWQADALKITQGKRLPPQVRTGLIEAMRQSVLGQRQTYDLQRTRFGDVARQQGIDPNQVLGPPLYDAIRPLEENYIRQHGETPQDPNSPPQQQEGDIGFNTPKQPKNPFTPEQQTAYDAFLKANPAATPDQLNSFIHSIGLPGSIGNAKDILGALNRTGQFIPASQAVEKPDISDVRGGNNTSAQDSINAVARGVGDTVSVGALDKIVALGDTVTKGGTFDQNLNRQYAISDYDQHNHPFMRLGGEALGGAVLPMGEVGSIGNVAAKGAAYGGAYGLGSSRQLSDIPANVVGGAITGAAVPAVLGKVLRPKTGGIDPLVDPVTGELNQPMVDSMAPAQRAAIMRAYGMKTLTPGMVGGRTARVLEQGLNNVPGSAGVMEDVNSAASGELRRSMQGVAQQFGQSKTMNEGGAELQRGATQYTDRADQLAAKLYDRIPISPSAPSSLANITGALQQLSGRFGSNPEMAEMLNNPQFSKYLEALQKHGLSWQDLKDFRTMVGDKIGEMRFGENDNTGDFRSLYGALSQDMRDTASAQGPGALRAFERANDFYQQKESLIEDSLTRILGPNAKGAPEKAAAAVQAMTKGGKATGDLKTLAQIRTATVKSGAWDEIASTIIHLGGQPNHSEGRAFSPQTFVQWYADMSEPARQMLFKPELRKSLDGFVAMNQQLSRMKGLNNTSNTTPTMIGSGVIAAGGIAAFSHPMAVLGIAGGGVANLGMAKLWTSPGFVRLITGYGRAAASGNQNAIRSQVGRLAKFAASNPEFSEPVQTILRQISNDNFVGPLAASPNANQQQNQQQPNGPNAVAGNEKP